MRIIAPSVHATEIWSIGISNQQPKLGRWNHISSSDQIMWSQKNAKMVGKNSAKIGTGFQRPNIGCWKPTTTSDQHIWSHEDAKKVEKMVGILAPGVPATKLNWSLEHKTSDHTLVAGVLHKQATNLFHCRRMRKRWEKIVPKLAPGVLETYNN